MASEPVAIVPEWPDEKGVPTLVYSDPWTVRDHEKFSKIHGEDKDWAAHIVVAKARTEDGSPLFDAADVVKLQTVGERQVVLRIAHCITFSLSMEEARKKLMALTDEETQSQSE